MSKYKGQQRNVTTYTYWKLSKKRAKQDSSSTQASVSLRNSRSSTSDASSRRKLSSCVQRQWKKLQRLLLQKTSKNSKACLEQWTSCPLSFLTWPRKPISCAVCLNETHTSHGPAACRRNLTTSRMTWLMQSSSSTMIQTSQQSSRQMLHWKGLVQF